MLVTIATALVDKVDATGVVFAVVFGVEVVVGDTVDVTALVNFLTVVFRDTADDDGDGVGAAVLAVTGVVGVAVPVLVFVFGAFVVLTTVVVEAVDFEALFTVIIGVSVTDWDVFGFRPSVVTVTSTREELVPVASAVFFTAGVVSATAVM